ncbi:MAG TPA: hypothetical protein VKA18_14440, partial [Alphaproteobacteria bacterium]|nr:hypothetical protein [Alphaproteobacteria bacterium]
GNLPRPDCIDVNRYEYRVEFRDIDGGGGWSPIVWSAAKGWQFLQRSFFFGCLGSTWNPYASDSDGWFSLATYWRAKSCHPDHAFAVWRTGGRDGHYALRLTMREIGDPATEVSSSVVQVQLDNTKPVRPPAADEHQAVQMDFYDLGGTILADQCTVDEATAAAVLIKGRVRDKHFRRYTMRWTGGDFHGWDHVDLGPGEGSDYRYYDAARPDLGGEGTIPGTATDVPLGRFDVVAEHTAETGNPPPECGFTVELRAYDRTIRGGFKPAENNYRDGYQNGWWESYNNSFCYKPKSAE